MGVTKDIPIQLQVGTTVDWLLHPIGYDSQDTTGYEVDIHGP